MSSPSATESWKRQILDEERAAPALARSRVRSTASNLILHLHPVLVLAVLSCCLERLKPWRWPLRSVTRWWYVHPMS